MLGRPQQERLLLYQMQSYVCLFKTIQLRRMGQALGTVAKTLIGKPISYTGVPGFKCQPFSQFQIPAQVHFRRQKVMVQIVEFLTHKRL